MELVVSGELRGYFGKPMAFGLHMPPIVAAGYRPDPNYEQVCTGVSGHAETVNVIFDTQKISLEEILKKSSGSVMIQPKECDKEMMSVVVSGSRSAIFCKDQAQLDIAIKSKNKFEATSSTVKLLEHYYRNKKYSRSKVILQRITHQQYLAKNPDGYCGTKGTGCAYV